MPILSGRQVESLGAALRDAFSLDEFSRLLYYAFRKRLEDIKDYVADHPELRNLFYPVPQVHGVTGIAANFVLHVSDLMNGKMRIKRVPAPKRQVQQQELAVA